MRNYSKRRERRTELFIDFFVVLAAAVAGVYIWHAGEMTRLTLQLQDEQTRKEQMSRRQFVGFILGLLSIIFLSL